MASGLTFNASFDCNANKVVVLPAQLGAAGPVPQPRSVAHWSARRTGWPTTRVRGSARALRGRPGDQDRRQGRGLAAVDFDLRTGFRDATRSRCSRKSHSRRSLSRRRSAAPTRWSSSRRPWISPTTGSGARWRPGMVVHPRTMKDPTTGAAVERAIGRLRYGSVTVNAWSGLLFAFGTPPWGAHPSSTPGGHPKRRRVGCTTRRCWRGSRRRSCATRSRRRPSRPIRSATAARTGSCGG